MQQFWNETVEMFNLNPTANLEGIWLVLALAFMGASVGVLTGLFGVGGGFLNVPLLNIIFGVPLPLAIGSSACLIVGTSSAGIGKHLRAGNVEPRVAVMLGLGSSLGAVLGDYIQDWMVESLTGGNDRQFDMMMKVLYIGLLALTAYLIWKPRPQKTDTHKSWLEKIPVPPRVDMPNIGISQISAPAIVALGIIIGIVAALFGVGGGILFVPVMMLLIHMDSQKAVGTSVLLVLITAIVSTAKKGYSGKVSLTIVMSLLLGSAIGVQYGVHLCSKLKSQRFKKYFVGVVLLAMGIVVFDLVRKIAADN